MNISEFNEYTIVIDEEVKYCISINIILTNYPVLHETPKTLQVKKITSNNRKFIYEYIDFISPYSNLVNTKKLSTGIAYEFDNGHKIIINKIKGDTYDVRDSLTSKQQKYICNLFGDEYTKSSFEFLKSVYSLTPDTISYFSPMSKLTLKKELLEFKNNLIPYQDSNGLYCFKTNNIKGFQYGNPQKDKIVILQVFTLNKNCTLSLVGDNIKQYDIELFCHLLMIHKQQPTKSNFFRYEKQYIS